MSNETLPPNIRTDEITGENDTKYRDVPPGGCVFFCFDQGGYVCQEFSGTNGASSVFLDLESALEQIAENHPATIVDGLFQHSIRLVLRP